ncbi:hypothetical protein IB244_29455 [Rhizobium sp. RHZ02]|uniref:hypothetical protein n=1 Tax=Rhizobium sp. RHZ02 TaxID=2769306 RepID=UPI00177EE2A2|nr:hypothetical protein [Rhizobium sp. RHZ02]MBD9455604.1 hypothetical protein [Rhizobium sp. RHZ02]
MQSRISLRSVCLIFISLIGIALSLRSIYTIHEYYIVPLYWDQWSFILDVMNDSSKTLSLSYLFRAHNEHIIASTKVLFLLDYLFFRLTNGPLVAAIALCAMILSISLAGLTYLHRRKDLEFIAFTCVLTASTLSLIQWENLLWGFQPQFYLVLIGAVVSMSAAVKLSETTEFRGQVFWFITLLIAAAFCIFSMGNGIAIPISIVIYFLLVRYNLRASILFAIIGAALMIPGFLAGMGAPKVGDLSLKTPMNIIAYVFAMIGNPIASVSENAVVLGVLVCAALGIVFVRAALIPWLRRKQIDKVSAALFALCSFLIATAMAAAYGRTSLGLGSASSSRYSTPMLFLLMTIFAILLRQRMIALPETDANRSSKIVVILFAMLATVTFTTFRPDVEQTYTALGMPIERAAYSVVSGVDDEAQLAHLFPDVRVLRPALEFLRRNQLNIFSPESGLSRPSAEDVQAASNTSQMETCKRASVDSTSRLAENQWKVSGWATDDKGATPRWIIATDQTGRLLGFTKPLEPRPDVAAAVAAEPHFRGFALSMASNGPPDEPIKLSIISRSGLPCFVIAPRLPYGPYVTNPLTLRVLPGEIAMEGEVAKPGVPNAIQAPPPYANATVMGTWASSDDNTGSVRYSLRDISCKDVFLPVLNGPNAQGVRLQVDYGEGLSDSIELLPFPRHQWNFFKLSVDKGCHNGSASLDVEIVDNGHSWGAWAAMALPGQAQ